MAGVLAGRERSDARQQRSGGQDVLDLRNDRERGDDPYTSQRCAGEVSEVDPGRVLGPHSENATEQHTDRCKGRHVDKDDAGDAVHEAHPGKR